MNKRNTYLEYLKIPMLFTRLFFAFIIFSIISFIPLSSNLYAGFIPAITATIKPIKAVIIKGKIVDRVTGQPLSATIKIFDMTSTRLGYLAESDKFGNYFVTTYPGAYSSSYYMKVYKEGYGTLAVSINVTMGRGYTINLPLTDIAPPLIKITSPLDNSFTNRTTITVTGTVDERAIVSINGISTAVINNSFTAGNVPLLTEGANNITVTAIDLSDNRTTKQITVIRDTIPPRNPGITIQQGNYTKNRNITLNLYALGSYEMLIAENPQFTNSRWEAFTATKAFTMSQGDGRKTVYVKYRDRAGNDTQTVNDSIILDTAPPQIQNIIPENNSITNQLQINITGAYTELNLDKILVNGVRAVVNGSNFTANGIQLSNEGDNRIEIKITDLAQNQNTYQLNIIRDTTPPQIQITSPGNNHITNQLQINITGTYTELNLDKILVNGVRAVVNGSNFTANGIQLSNEGDNRVEIKITDLAQNQNTYQLNIIRDTIPPQNPSIIIQQGDYTNNSTINLILSAQDAVAMVISEDPQFTNPQWEAYTATKAVTLSSGDGNKTVYLKYRDLAQNETQPVTDSIILDTTPPQIQITSPGNDYITNQSQVNISGTFIEANLNTITINDSSVTLQGNTFTAGNVPLTNEGNNTIIATAGDLAGNQNSSQINVTRDTIPPQNPNVTISEGSTTQNRLIHITLQADGAHMMMISEDNGFHNVNWESFVTRKEFTLSEGLGEKNIYFKFMDIAGNETGIIGRSITLVGLGKPESQGLVKVIGRRLFVNNQPYIIKGVTYQPTPIDYCPWWLDVYTEENCDRDFNLLRNMGCNTIRTYGNVTETLLIKAEQYGIKVCAGFWVSYDYDFADQSTRSGLISEFRNYVIQFKNYPSILMWVIGNEQNAQNGNNAAWYSLANEMAAAAYEEEGINYHPVAITNGGSNNIGNFFMSADDDSLYYIDIWGINVYAGYSFIDNPSYPNYFSGYSQKSSKPLWISEYGIDAYDNAHNIESQKRQAAWDSHAWDEIAGSDICIGATLMSYSDEWWKDATPNIHTNGGFNTANMRYPDCAPDRFLNEEWWGIAAVSDNGSNPDIVTLRLAYYALKKRWSSQQDARLVDDYNDGCDPNLLGGSSFIFNSGNPGDFCSYIYTNNENRQCLAISYDTDNVNSYAGYCTILNGLDVRPYDSISCFIKGQNGGETIKIGLKDRTGNEAKINLSEYLTEGIINSWQRVVIPLTSFGNNVNLADLDSIILAFEYAIGSACGVIYVDDIGFGADVPSIIVTNFNSGENHKQNALGFSPWLHQAGSSQISYQINPNCGEGDTGGLCISYEVSGGTYCRLGMGLCGIDVSPYEKLRLSVKGAQDTQKFNLYLEDYWHNRAYVRVENITTDWQRKEIPLHSFVFQKVDITNLINLEIVFEWEDRSGDVYLDNIEFTD